MGGVGGVWYVFFGMRDKNNNNNKKYPLPGVAVHYVEQLDRESG